MSRSETMAWLDFYRLYPFDDFNRFHRPAALVATSMNKADVSKLLDWLQPPPSRPDIDYSEADMNTFSAFGFKPPKG